MLGEPEGEALAQRAVQPAAAEPERWIEVRVAVPLAHAEPIADALGARAAGGSSIEPALLPDDARDFAYELDAEAPVQVRAWLAALPAASTETLREAQIEVETVLATLDLPVDVEPVLVFVEPPDWAQEWRRFYHPLRVGRRLLLCPPWDRVAPGPGEVAIVLDPGRAFGTGQHESTRLCLAALERHLIPGCGAAGCEVIDLGTGSGVLAVAAARLGARSVRALDIDPEAIEAARDTAAANGVTGRVAAAVGSLGDAWPWSVPPGNSADLLLANLSQPLLCTLAPAIARALRPGGVLIAAGYLERDATTVGDALEIAGLRILRVDAEGEWRCHVAVATGVAAAEAAD